MVLPQAKSRTLENIVHDLKDVDNIVAIVLGGSQCTGMANENSDLDIGLYYHEDSPFDIERIRLIAEKYNIDETLTVTGFYQWGPWVNGGAWLNTVSGEVDFVYRNIEQVKSVIEKSRKGIWENDFDQQPPFGFSSVIYLAETRYCYPLYDPQDAIKEMKKAVEDYPEKLRQTIIQQSLWGAEFTLWQADKFAGKQDMYNTMGCFTRALKCLVDAIFALNETYYLGDKHAIQTITQLPVCPVDLKGQIEHILSTDSRTLTASAERIRSLFDQVGSLAGERYQPYFIL